MPRLAAPSVKRNASRLANVLDDAHIPYFMWGWTALGLMGQDWGFPEIDFVVPDTMIKDAAHALARAGNLICNDPGCPQGRQDRATSRALVIARDRFHMLPEKHFHLVGGNVLLLHRKSNIAWWLPDLQAGPPAADDPHFILSTDEERLPPRAVDGPSGPWTQYYPVKIMNPGSFTESIMIHGSSHSSNLKPVTLALAGKSPNIIFPDADLVSAVDWSAWGINMNFHESTSTKMSTASFWPNSRIARARSASHIPLTPRRLKCPEIKIIAKFSSEAEVIKQANSTTYGLAAACHTKDYKRAIRITNALRAGTTWVNMYNFVHWSVPFGGYKESGIGRESGEAVSEALRWGRG
ncbi:Aldehyde/histidinol dehydrogenase [Aspergillus pseudodeflectus]|uniref:aldehyde dehydrogenase (NAD(+)) n=1 Tax=Aspergillus pseudodeflectus TaxID=176178 RepID=A0ABR4JU38_9EURO